MPLFTYVAAYKGKTAVVQARRSSFKGWLAQAAHDAFPDISSDDLGVIMRLDPQPLPNLMRTWGCSTTISGGLFGLHIVETRD